VGFFVSGHSLVAHANHPPLLSRRSTAAPTGFETISTEYNDCQCCNASPPHMLLHKYYLNIGRDT